MKKLFTFKNILIVLFLLAVAAYLMCVVIPHLDSAKMYNDLISNIADGENNFALQAYIDAKNRLLIIGISNIVSFSFIVIFILLFLSTLFHKFDCIKFAFISLAFLCFTSSVAQVGLIYFIGDILSIAISALIALLIGIALYVYLLIKEIQKRKKPVAEQVQEASVEPSSVEQPQDPTQE